jgi:hypothetical protein
MKTKIHDKILAGICLLIVTLNVLPVLSGCASRTRMEVSQSASVGQQLQDLEKSYKDGIISKKEYDRLKKALINKND